MLPVAAGGGAGACPRLMKKVELFRNPALDRASVIECDSREKQKTRDSPVHESCCCFAALCLSVPAG